MAFYQDLFERVLVGVGFVIQIYLDANMLLRTLLVVRALTVRQMLPMFWAYKL